jgi:hypothetical protein
MKSLIDILKELLPEYVIYESQINEDFYVYRDHLNLVRLTIKSDSIILFSCYDRVGNSGVDTEEVVVILGDPKSMDQIVEFVHKHLPLKP